MAGVGGKRAKKIMRCSGSEGRPGCPDSSGCQAILGGRTGCLRQKWGKELGMSEVGEASPKVAV